MEIHTLSDIITALNGPASVDPQPEDMLCIEIRRDFVLTDALREGRKRKFDPLKALRVS